MTDEAHNLAPDLLEGAAEIACYLYGDPNKRRKVYHLAATSNFPFFKMGSVLCARRSIVQSWIEAQERRHANDNNKPAGKIVPRGKV